MANSTSSDTSRGSSSPSKYNGKSGDIEQKLGDAVNAVGTSVGSVASDFSEASMEALDKSKKYVESNPGKGVLIGAGFGLIVGLLLSMASRSSSNHQKYSN